MRRETSYGESETERPHGGSYGLGGQVGAHTHLGPWVGSRVGLSLFLVLATPSLSQTN